MAKKRKRARANEARTSEAGAELQVVDGAAESAGLKRGLVIYQVGRYDVSSAKQIEDLLEPVSTGSVVDFTVGIVRHVRGQALRQLQTVSVSAR